MTASWLLKKRLSPLKRSKSLMMINEMPKPTPHNIVWNGDIQDMKKTMVKRGSSIVTHTGFGCYLSIHK